MFPHPEYVLTPFGWGNIIGDPRSIAAEMYVELENPSSEQNKVVMVDYRDIVHYDDIHNCAVYFNLEPSQYNPNPLPSYCKFDYGWIPREVAIHPMDKNTAKGTRYSLGTFSGHWGAWPVRPFESPYILLRVGVNRSLEHATQEPVHLGNDQSVEAWLNAYRQQFTWAALGIEMHALLEQITSERKIVWRDFLIRDGWSRKYAQRTAQSSATAG